MSENLSKKQEEIAEFKPGDKIYKLFSHKEVIIRGKKIILLSKSKKSKKLVILGPWAGKSTSTFSACFLC